MAFQPFVSVVVCVNRFPLIFKNCLDSLKRQTYPQKCYEIILVDATKNGECVTLFSDQNLQIVPTTSISRGNMLNVGTKVAKGEIVAYTDADVIVSRTWLSNLVVGFINEQTVGTGGNVIMGGKACYDLPSQGQTDNNGYLLFDRTNILSKKGAIRIPHFLGANCAFRKGILEKEGYYIETLPDVGCEDVDLCVRLLKKGYKLRFVNALIYHPDRSTKSRITNGIRDGRALCLLLKRHQSNLIQSTYLRLVKNLVYDKGSPLMLIGFIDEASKRRHL